MQKFACQSLQAGEFLCIDAICSLEHVKPFLGLHGHAKFPILFLITLCQSLCPGCLAVPVQRIDVLDHRLQRRGGEHILVVRAPKRVGKASDEAPAVPVVPAQGAVRPGCFFVLWPLFARAPWFFLALASPKSRAAQRGATKNTLHTRGRQQKKILETNDTGHEQKGATKLKKKTHSLRPWTAMLTHFFSWRLFRPGPAGVLFFAAAPRGRSLTHCGPGRRCLPPGWCFFFLLRPRPDRGGVFSFAVAPSGSSLTHCGLGRFRQGPGGVLFCCGPTEPGEPITKNVWCTTSGLKRPGGATAKNTPLPRRCSIGTMNLKKRAGRVLLRNLVQQQHPS